MDGYVYILFALLALGFLIFIHELGHYWMARREGMRVEAFAIGFGPPLLSWTRDNVEWRICLFPFGGYVKIAGMYDEDVIDPRAIRDGYFGKSPWARIKVAFMGPLVNILFALFLFTLIWGIGGREKTFSEYTRRVGWVDPKSELYASGVRPGDAIFSYDGQEVNGFRDHLTAPLLNDAKLTIVGEKAPSTARQATPFTVEVTSYPHPEAIEPGILTAGVLAPANYVIYDRFAGDIDNPIPEETPIAASGLQYGDRVFWVDGVVIYSAKQLSEVINDGRALLTIQRGEKTLLARVPRIHMEEFRLNEEVFEEVTDWQFEADLRNHSFKQLYFLPYNLSANCEVEEVLTLVDQEDQEKFFPKHLAVPIDAPLQPGDQIIAVDGHPVTRGHELLARLQTHEVHVIVERGENYLQAVAVEEADSSFNADIPWSSLGEMTTSIGTRKPLTQVGSLHLLKPFTPVSVTSFLEKQEDGGTVLKAIEAERKKLQQIEDTTERNRQLALLEKQQQQLILGVPGIQDRRVLFNPDPITAFTDLLMETASTLSALVTGNLSPKFLAGPVGIVHAIQRHWSLGMTDVLFLLAFISQQLGFLNLLPIPVLDGGHICFSLWEIITGKPLRQKTMEWLTVPFYFLLIILAISLTYNDVLRIFRGFFGG